MFIIPALRRLRQKYYHQFKANLSYIVEIQANLDYRVVFGLKRPKQLKFKLKIFLLIYK